jgi:hypothetical protein
MAPRAQLQSLLETSCDNVYFQPPPDVQMNYPAIVYERRRAETYHANNAPYCVVKQYQIMLISRSPDSPLYDTIVGLPMCTHERFYVADNLNHDVFSIYF